MRPGIYKESECSMDAYHAAKVIVGRSALKLLDEGVPADVQRYYNAPPQEGTVAVAFGTATQTCLRSVADFKAQYVRQPVFAGPNADEQFKGTGAKARIEAWKGANAHRLCLPASDYDQVHEAAREIKATPIAARILSIPDLQHETSFVWAEEKHGGRLVKARPDFWSPSLGMTADLKVDGRGDLSDRKLAEYVATYYAHLQGAMCMRGVVASGHAFTAHILIVVRRQNPVKCRIVKMKLIDKKAQPSWLECGEAQFDALLAEFVECERRNSWPDYGDQATTLPVPAYVSSKLSTYTERLNRATPSKESAA